MTITAIQKRRRQARYDIYLDGSYYATLSEDGIISNRLHEGLQVDEREFAALIQTAERQDAVAYMLSALSSRAYTRRHARDKLKERGFSADAVDFALEKMEYYGYIDDEAYCRDYIAECHGTRSTRRIKQDLWEKGIAQGIVEKYIADNDEHDACYLSLSRKAKGKDFTADFIVKLIRYLLGQGYEYDMVRRCLEEYAAHDEQD